MTAFTCVVLGHSRLEISGYAKVTDTLIVFANDDVDVEELHAGLPAVVSQRLTEKIKKPGPPSLITA